MKFILHRTQRETKLKLEQLNRQPVIGSSVTMSKDRKWITHKTVINNIKPVTYMKKVFEERRVN